jgi:hypothetical protein
MDRIKNCKLKKLINLDNSQNGKLKRIVVYNDFKYNTFYL